MSMPTYSRLVTTDCATSGIPTRQGIAQLMVFGSLSVSGCVYSVIPLGNYYLVIPRAESYGPAGMRLGEENAAYWRVPRRVGLTGIAVGLLNGDLRCDGSSQLSSFIAI